MDRQVSQQNWRIWWRIENAEFGIRCENRNQHILNYPRFITFLHVLPRSAKMVVAKRTACHFHAALSATRSTTSAQTQRSRRSRHLLCHDVAPGAPARRPQLQKDNLYIVAQRRRVDCLPVGYKFISKMFSLSLSRTSSRSSYF